MRQPTKRFPRPSSSDARMSDPVTRAATTKRRAPPPAVYFILSGAMDAHGPTDGMPAHWDLLRVPSLPRPLERIAPAHLEALQRDGEQVLAFLGLPQRDVILDNA